MSVRSGIVASGAAPEENTRVILRELYIIITGRANILKANAADLKHKCSTGLTLGQAGG